MGDRSRKQVWAESALAPHPQRLELRGSPAELSWPNLCAHCGEPALDRIVVKKVFRPLPRRHGSGSVGLRAYRIDSAAIPFCGMCAATHRTRVERTSMAKKMLRLVFHPLIIPVLGFSWLTTVFWRNFRTTPIADPRGFPEWAAIGLLLTALAWCVFLLWRTTAPSRLEPQTDITRSCDFSEDVSGFLEKERRIYALANKSFADALAALNVNRVWTAEEQTKSRKRELWVAALLLASLLGAIALLKFFGF